ncbi:MAG: translation initiation factor IF-2 [Gammaproteobacteria bacterium WSBS_2016_MAG_OTU1]
MTTTTDIAKKYGKSHNDIKVALLAVGFEKGRGVIITVPPDVERKLDAYFLEASAEEEKPAAAKTSSTSRSIGGVQITTKKQRTINRPVKPTPAPAPAPAASAAPAPAPAPAPVASAAPAPAPATAKKEDKKVTAAVAETTPPATKPVAKTSAAKTKKVVAESTPPPKAADKKATAETTVKPDKLPEETVEIKTTSDDEKKIPPKVSEEVASDEVAAIPATPPPANDLYTKQIAAQKGREAAIISQNAKYAEMVAAKAASAAAAVAAKKAEKVESKVATESKKIGRGKTITLDDKTIADRKKRRQQRTPSTKKMPANQHGFKAPAGFVGRDLPLPETISVSTLANEMAVKTGIVIRKLMDYGMEDASPNLVLKREEAWVVVEEFGHKPVLMEDEKEDLEKSVLLAEDVNVVQEPRSPVVTIMGHVDHGKTSLLDYIRKTRVAMGEAGGITQHIGAYQVIRPSGNITFLDTPGHALFSQMRARGAQVTDIIVLVVAGDDGIKPQTQEAIAHAQAAKVPLVVAVNKIDKPGIDLERINTELSQHNVLPEAWGGDAMVVPLSAHTGEGIDKLLDAIHTQSELLELKAAWDVPARATVVDACIDKGRGVVATVIIRQGVLRRNDYAVCGTESGRVRAMWDSAGKMQQEALPSMPVEIQGLSGMPEVGEDLLVVQDERKAREVANMRQDRHRIKTINARVATRSVSSILSNEIDEKKELNVIVKADMGGSREALTAALTATSGKKGAIKVIHSAVGGVSESDINLARASNAIIIAYNVRPDSKSRKLAQSYNIKIMAGNVIYEIIESAKKAVLDLLDAEREERIIGMAEVIKVFSISKVGNIAGCRVSEGIIRADVRARLVRDGAIVYEGDIHSLRHFKEESEEVRNGEECGISIRRFNAIKVGDVIEAVQIIETPPTL